MNLYKISVPTASESPVKTTYQCTLEAAHTYAKELSTSLRDEIRIEKISITVDQAAVANILSGWGINELVVKTWGLTSRGGLRDLPNGE